MPHRKLLVLALLASLSAACAPQAEDTTQTAEPTPEITAEQTVTAVAVYRVEFTPTWTKANFPFEYPDTSLLHKPHFSGWIGTGHDAGFRLFQEGALPTPGLEALSEQGKHSPLDAEIAAAIAAGHALESSRSDPLKDFGKTVVFEVKVDQAHPLVSAAAMIAPSPDWFAGVEATNLLENGAWVPSKTVEVMAWDSGGDDGATYLADDRNNDPKKPTTPAGTSHFVQDGKAMPVGRLVFTRL